MIALFILAFVIYAFGDGLSDGIAHRLHHERHWTKWPPRIGWAYCVFFGIYYAYTPTLWVMLLGMLLSFKPLFDIGWSVGAKAKERIHIGTTDWTDILLRKTGLVKMEETKFPIITILYYFSMCIGLYLIYLSFIYVR